MMQNGKPRAFLNVCMHHGGSLKLDGDIFTCESHGSTFDARTGKALSGPFRGGFSRDRARLARRAPVATCGPRRGGRSEEWP